MVMQGGFRGHHFLVLYAVICSSVVVDCGYEKGFRGHHFLVLYV